MVRKGMLLLEFVDQIRGVGREHWISSRNLYPLLTMILLGSLNVHVSGMVSFPIAEDMISDPDSVCIVNTRKSTFWVRRSFAGDGHGSTASTNMNKASPPSKTGKSTVDISGPGKRASQSTKSQS